MTLLLLFACTDPGKSPDNLGVADSGSTDSGSTDSGSTDSRSADSGSADSGSADSGSTDSGSTGSTDSGSTDSGSTDPPPTWTSLASIPVDIQEVAVEVLDGRLYVVGGLGGSTDGLTSVWIFDGTSWTMGAALPMAVHHVNLVALDGTLYALGAMGLGFQPHNVVWSWTPGDPAWTEHPPLDEDLFRGASAVGVMGDEIWVVGGSAGGSVATAFAWRPDVGVTRRLPDLPIPLDHLGGEVVGDNFYVLAGRSFGVTAVQDGVWRLAADGDAWEARAPVPTPRGGVATGEIDGKIYVIGGEGNPDNASGVFDNTERYDPATDTWELLPPMPTPRHGTQGGVLNGQIVVPGGATVEGVGAVSVVEALQP